MPLAVLRNFHAPCHRPTITPAGSTESVAHPYNNRIKCYAVLSVGRQTFASKKVRRAGERPSTVDLLHGSSVTVASSGGSATAAVAVSGGSATAAVAPSGSSASRRGADDGVAVFRWEEGTDVVLQRSGATLAQIAVYAAGRVDGALGDELQVRAASGATCVRAFVCVLYGCATCGTRAR